VISGLLIYRSYTKSSSVKSYFEKRVRRIYPAYFVIIVLSALVLCALSTCPPGQYFGLGFWKYLGANLVFLNFLAPSLPGVFSSHILSAVNGALWTLKIEAAFYLFVPILHFLSERFGVKRTIATLFALSCLWKYSFLSLAAWEDARRANAADHLRNIYADLSVQFPAQLVYFCAGILILLYFDQLKRYFLSIFCITVVFFLLDHGVAKEKLDIVWISGFIFIFGFWRYFGNFSKHGDFSYGVYIVHWPILQFLIAIGMLKAGPVAFFAASVLSIALAAFAMWHLVESKFLATSSHYRQVSQNKSIKEPLA
jgi:peptidoglycan/LPS O-acetylase OafA/YrhL